MVNRRLRDVFTYAPNSIRVLFLIRRCLIPVHEELKEPKHPYQNSDGPLSSLLRYRACSLDVLQLILQHPMCPKFAKPPMVPRRLYKNLRPSGSPFTLEDKEDEFARIESSRPVYRKDAWSETDYPLPFLNFLFSCPQIPEPNILSGRSGEYGLSKAVNCNFVPLIRFLLSHGADPSRKDALAVKIAILRKDLSLVRMLIEREEDPNVDSRKKGTQKRRRLEDRMTVSQPLLREAVRSGARSIVSYFVKEKGATPDMTTLGLMDSKGIYG